MGVHRPANPRMAALLAALAIVATAFTLSEWLQGSPALPSLVLLSLSLAALAVAPWFRRAEPQVPSRSACHKCGAEPREALPFCLMCGAFPRLPPTT
jgi:hypothetical protein